MSNETKDHGLWFLKELPFMHGGCSGSNCSLQGQRWRKNIVPTQEKQHSEGNTG
jgi:hypothetical protein